MCRQDQQDGTDHCSYWYGSPAGNTDLNEAQVKFEHASLVWLPVFCPGQPVVWVSSPMLLRRYAAITDPSLLSHLPSPETCSSGLKGRRGENGVVLFFNLGFMDVQPVEGLQDWIPPALRGSIPPDRLVVVEDTDIGAIHDMALYRQSRVKLDDEEKKVTPGAFFNVEALPEGSALIFPIGIRPPREGKISSWQPFGTISSEKLYFGGLESIGFGRCEVTFSNNENQEAA
jgi:CRISPR-associated protein Cmr4